MHLQVHLLPKEGVNKSEISSGFHIYQSMTRYSSWLKVFVPDAADAALI